MIAGTLEIQLLANMARLQKDMDDAKRHVGGAMASIERSVGVAKSAFIGLAAGMASALTVGAFVGQVRKAVDTLAMLDDAAQKTGSSVENLSKMQKVATAFNQDFGLIDASLSKLAKGMAALDDESNKTQQALKALGVSSVDESGNLRDTSQVMIEVAKSMQNYKDDASKAAVATDLFGKAGAELIPYMNDLAENVDKFSGASDKAAKQASELQDQLGMTRVKVTDLFEKMSIALLPTMLDVIDALTDTGTEAGDLSKDKNLTLWADNLAESVATAADYVNNLMVLMRGAGQIAGEVAAKSQIKIDGYKERSGLLDGVSSLRQWTGFIPDDIQQKLDASHARERAAIDAATAAGSEDRGGMLNGVGQFTRALNDRRESARFGSINAEMALISGATGGAQDGRAGLNYTGTTPKAGKPNNDAAKEAKKVADELAKAEMAAAQAHMKFVESLASGLESMQANTLAQQEYNDRLGLSKEAIAALDAVKLEEQATALEGLAIKKLDKDLDETQYELYKAQADELRKLAKLKQSGASKESFLEAQKKEAEEAKKVWDNFTENVQRNLGDGLYDAMNGNFKSIGDGFKSLMLRMVADAMAANLSKAMFTGGDSGKGWVGTAINAFSGMLGGGGGGYSVGGDAGVGLMSFDGGGYTGNGPRSGGLDGKGGFLIMGHPQETITDHTKGQSAGGGKSITIHYAPQINVDSRADRGAIMSDVGQMLQADKAQLMDQMDRERI